MATESLSWADSVWGHRCDGNCADGRGRSIITDGETYQGGFQVSQQLPLDSTVAKDINLTRPFQGGERHGQGLRKWPDGTSYDGQYHHDLRHGCVHFFVLFSLSSFCHFFCPFCPDSAFTLGLE